MHTLQPYDVKRMIVKIIWIAFYRGTQNDAINRRIATYFMNSHIIPRTILINAR